MDPTLIQNFSTKHFPNRTLCKLYSLQQINLFRDKRQLKSNFDLTRWPTRVFKANSNKMRAQFIAEFFAEDVDKN